MMKYYTFVSTERATKEQGGNKFTSAMFTVDKKKIASFSLNNGALFADMFDGKGNNVRSMMLWNEHDGAELKSNAFKVYANEMTLYDNGGATADRYTLIDRKNDAVYNLSEHENNTNPVNVFACDISEYKRGDDDKKIALSDVSRKTQIAIMKRLYT